MEGRIFFLVSGLFGLSRLLRRTVGNRGVAVCNSGRRAPGAPNCFPEAAEGTAGCVSLRNTSGSLGPQPAIPEIMRSPTVIVLITFCPPKHADIRSGAVNHPQEETGHTAAQCSTCHPITSAKSSVNSVEDLRSKCAAALSAQGRTEQGGQYLPALVAGKYSPAPARSGSHGHYMQ